MTINLSAGQLLLAIAVVGAVLTLVVKSRIGSRRAHAAAEIARAGTSAVSLAGRVIVTALVIVGAQWLVITHPGNPTLLWVVLGLPALIASYTLTKALTVTEVRSSRRGGGRR